MHYAFSILQNTYAHFKCHLAVLNQFVNLQYKVVVIMKQQHIHASVQVATVNYGNTVNFL